jgi:hypothetical protein
MLSAVSMLSKKPVANVNNESTLPIEQRLGEKTLGK